MNRNFVDWYRTANIEPTSERLENRWNGIINFIEEHVQKEYVFELIKMYYSQPTGEKFCDEYVECFIEADSIFDKNNKLELSVLAGATLVEIIENCDYSILAMVAFMSYSFLKNTPLIPDINDRIKHRFIEKTCLTREKILDYDITYASEEFDALIQEIEGAETVSSELLIDCVNEVNKSLKNLFKKQEYNKMINSVYAEDSQILWWMTSGWSNDLDKHLHDIKQADASIIIGKELADKINILPGPYSSRAVLHKMLDCCNKRGKCGTLTLKNAIENLDIMWRENCVKKYDVNKTQEITPIIFAISKSLTVDQGEDWGPQFKKNFGYGAEEVMGSVEEMAFQMYLECLVIKCYVKE